LSAGGGFAESHPLTPLVGDGEWHAGSEPRAQSHEPVPIGARQCRRSSGARGAFHRRRPARTPLRAPVRSAAAAGQRGRPPHVFIEVRELRLDPCPLAIRERLRGRVRFFGFCRWMSPRARLRTVRTSRATGVAGTTVWVDRKLPFDRTAAEGTQGQGPRTPCLDTPHRDCSRRRLRPNPDRFGHLLSRTPISSLSGVTWGENDAAVAARACKARVARGPCGGRFPRRNRTLTNPRDLPSLAVRGANGGRLSETDELFGRPRPAPFSPPETRARDARTCLVGSASWQGRAASCSIADGPQRPLTTSAFE